MINLESKIHLNNHLEKAKAAFNNDEITTDQYLQTYTLYNTLVKGDPTSNGQLTPLKTKNKQGIEETTWVTKQELMAKRPPKPGIASTEAQKHSPEVLAAFARETPEKALKSLIVESKEEHLKLAAETELNRRRGESIVETVCDMYDLIQKMTPQQRIDIKKKIEKGSYEGISTKAAELAILAISEFS